MSIDRRVYVGRYVIMPDHLHLFAAFAPVAPPLSEWTKGLKRALAEEMKRGRLQGPYWQKGFFDHVLRSNDSYSQKWDYVWQNPVRAGLVPKAEHWPYQGEIQPLTMQ
jgi:REP-associated tyrosine transposase